MINLRNAAGAFAVSLVAVPTVAATPPGTFGVGTSAVTGQYLDGYGGVESNGAAYRMGQDGSGNYTVMGDVAPVNFDNCAGINANNPQTCFATQGGTTGPGFAETLSASNASLSFERGYGPWLAGASTYADLSTGKLGASGSTSYYQTAQTVAKFVDTLNFNVDGADGSTITNIIVKFRLDGGLEANDVGFGASGLATQRASISDFFSFGSANGQVGFTLVGSNATYDPPGLPSRHLDQSNGQNGWVSYSWDIVSPGLTEFTGVYALSGISQSLEIFNSLSGFAATGASFSYGNSSKLSLVLPSNVTFTSASGVFLNANGVPPVPVPEPASWALMIAGFAAAGAALRRKKLALQYN